MYALTIPPLRTMAFLAERPADGRWEVQDDVEIDIPPNFSDWPEGVEAPEQVLCISTSDPKYYKLFKYARDIDPAEFKETGMAFGGVYSRTAWSRFATSLSAALGDDDVGVDEPAGATEDAVRAIKAGR